MGNSLAERTGRQTRGDGRRGGLVLPDWRSEHSASLVAIRRLGRAQGAEGDELGRGRLGRHRPQDRAIDSNHEESNLDSDAVESRGLVSNKAERVWLEEDWRTRESMWKAGSLTCMV